MYIKIATVEEGRRERERQSPSQRHDCRSRRSALAMGHTYPLPLGDAPLLTLRAVCNLLIASMRLSASMRFTVDCEFHRRLPLSIKTSNTIDLDHVSFAGVTAPFDKGQSDARPPHLWAKCGARRPL